MRKRTKAIIIVTILIVLSYTLINNLFLRYRVETLITDKTAISIHQRLTIKFQNTLTKDDIDNLKVTVKDSNGNELENYIYTGIDMKSINIDPPKGGYKEGENYTVNVDTEIPFVWDRDNSTSNTISFTPRRAYENKRVKFKDKNLENLIREMINKPTGPIYVNDVEGITMLIANGENIKSIYGIEYLVNLDSLYLDANEIEDIRPISNLVYLQKLGLSHNKIIDIEPLRDMNLKYLALGDNKIKDYSPIMEIYNQLLWKDFEIN